MLVYLYLQKSNSMPNTSFIRFTLYFICGLFILSCKSKVATNEPNPYIFANTSGIISKTDPIKVIFAGNMVEPKAVGGYITSDAFSISPSVEGKAVWQDEKTLVFKPTKELESTPRKCGCGRVRLSPGRAARCVVRYSGATMSTILRLRRWSKLTMPSARANNVSSLPRPTLLPA
jgi:hypothetical protein